MKKTRTVVLLFIFILASGSYYYQNKFFIDEFYKGLSFNESKEDKYTEVKFNIKKLNNLTYRDLLTLSKVHEPTGELNQKLKKQLNTPYIVRSVFSNKEKLTNSHIRVAHWNIERGRNLYSVVDIFQNPTGFYYKNRSNINVKNHNAFKKEVMTFSNSDIISLNEVDVGVPRTNYKNVAGEIAKSLKWNYVFAPEFIELGDIYSGKFVDQEKYTGLHGNAIISRYPIVKAKIIRLPTCYHWYKSEIRKKSPLEYVRRFGAKKLFEESIFSKEVRHGGRNALVADIKLPNNQIITVVSTHLEDKCLSSGRYRQLKFLLEDLKDVRTPLVLAGDLNTSNADSSPISVSGELVKRIKDPEYLIRQTAVIFIPGAPLGSGVISTLGSRIFQYKDPTVLSVPVLFPNKERKFFSYVKNHLFSDGEKFDLSGDNKRSSNGKDGFLANSNERHGKGFESTFEFEAPRLIGYFKLDWIFVKPKRNKFKPFNGQTLKLLNKAYKDKISDHDPLIVDLSI